jgi:hypothetical protein
MEHEPRPELSRWVRRRSSSFSVPLEALGCHIDAAKCHVTGRRLSIETLNLTGKGAIFSGAALMQGGLQLPHAFPETCLLFYVAAI